MSTTLKALKPPPRESSHAFFKRAETILPAPRRNRDGYARFSGCELRESIGMYFQKRGNRFSFTPLNGEKAGMRGLKRSSQSFRL